ncbi:MAG: hypothetical protein KAR20_21140 [Candidatus Heimdallarchaeota archaeon]|nr:hypothetical protein [Candidatus Heimdallarchaeota archaeon]
MRKSKYEYDFPRQRKMAGKLERGDIGIIAELTKHHPKYISMVFSGKRRITDKIMNAFQLVLDANLAKKKVIKAGAKKIK